MTCLYPRWYSCGVMHTVWVEAETSIQQVCTNFLCVEHNLVWTHHLSNRWSVQIQYWGQFYRYTEPRRVQIGIDHLSALVNWRF